MPNNKLHPIIEIRKPHIPPAHGPYSLYATSDKRWSEAKASGGIKNLRRYNLDQSLGGFLDNAGTDNEHERRSRAISLDYALKPQDQYNSLTAWETLPTAEEAEMLQVQRDKYTLLRDELQEEKDAAPEGNLSIEKLDLLYDYQRIVDQMALLSAMSLSGQVGFLERIPSTFGLGGHCLYDHNGAANVPKVRRSTFKLDPDRPFHLSLKFSNPHTGQIPTSFKLWWGPFALEFRGGNKVLLSVYKKSVYGKGGYREKQALAQMERRLNQYLDTGRITTQDMVYIEEKKNEIRRLEKEVREKKIKADDPAYRPYLNQIAQLQEDIRARDALKDRMPGDIAYKADLLIKQMFSVYEQRINLQESAENFYGVPIRLTVLPQRRGFLTLTLRGSEPVTVDLPEVIETKEYQTLWHADFLTWKNNGGAVEWQFLYPTIDSAGEFRLKDVNVGFDITGEVALLSGDWDESGPGCDITFHVFKGEKWTAARPYFFDFVAKFESDGRYLPWLYSLNFFINSAERTPSGETVFNSQDFGTIYSFVPSAPNVNRDTPILDTQVSYSDISETRRDALYNFALHDPIGSLLLPDIHDHVIDFKVGLWNSADGVQGIVPYLTSGIIRRATAGNVRELGEGINWIAGEDTAHAIEAHSIWALVDEYEIAHEVNLSNRPLGEVLYICLGMVGFSAAERAGIDQTIGPRMPKPGVGERPREMTPLGQKMGHYLRYLLDVYGMTDDGQEIRLHAPGGIFTTDVPDETIKFNFSGAADVTGPQVVKYGAATPEDWSQFFNVFEVQGRRDRITGKRPSARITLHRSIDDEDYELYIGREKKYDLLLNDSLETQAQVERAVETLAVRHSKSGRFRQYETFWQYPPIYPGDRGYIDGVLCEAVSVPSMNMADGTSCIITARKVVPFAL